VVAALLYHRLAERLKGFANATPQTLFAKFVNTPGRIEIVGPSAAKGIRDEFSRSRRRPGWDVLCVR
jgi:hypothetical protein